MDLLPHRTFQSANFFFGNQENAEINIREYVRPRQNAKICIREYKLGYSNSWLMLHKQCTYHHVADIGLIQKLYVTFLVNNYYFDL
jgi:hypothetical protein